MASQSLLNAQIDQGKATLSALDAAGLDIRASFWVLDDDTQTWRFTVAEPTVDVEGTHALYGRVAQALRGCPDVLPLHEIYAVSPNDQVVSLVRLAVTTSGTAVSGISFTGHAVMGSMVPDMYIYRMYGPALARAAP